MSKTQVKWDQVISFSESESIPLCNWIDLGNGTMFRIAAFFTYRHLNMSRDGLFIAIERVGSFLFAIDKPLHYAYVSNKLFVPESDARALADWINTQLGYKADQQGEYNPDYINAVEPVMYAGEKALLPLTPRIVGNDKTN